MFLSLVPGGQMFVVLGLLGVVLSHDDRVAADLAVLVTEVVLPVPDGDSVLNQHCSHLKFGDC